MTDSNSQKEKSKATNRSGRNLKVILIVLLVIAVIAAVIIYFLFSQSNKVSKAPQFLYAIGGNTNSLKEPTYAIADEKGTVYVADSGNHRVRIFDNKGTYKADLGGPNSKKPLVYPYGIALLDNGRVLVADLGAGALYEYTVRGDYVKAWLSAGKNFQPAGISVGPDQQTIYVTDIVGKQVLVFDQKGQLVKKIKPLLTKLDVPLGIVANQDGSVWVADGGNYNVKLLNSNEQVKTVFDGGPKKSMITAKGLALDKQGRIYVADTMANEVRVFDNQGNDLFSIDQQPNLMLPNGLSIDSANRIYIANQGSNQIQVWGWIR